jgi:rfaE bifunctional protein kinase chain/domain/rfaE bifunctional protein nucleotidyltransferase chain/domain
MQDRHKIQSFESLLALRRASSASGKTVVHCHGCFDIVHPGHIQYLQFARSLGDLLIVTVSADRQVNKGVDRPLIPDDLRAASLAALQCVDAVYVNPDPTAVEILAALKPDIYVKGREYETNQDPRFLAERDTVAAHGGRVVFSSGDIVYSSTSLIGSLGSTDAIADEKVRRFRDDFGLSDGQLGRLLLSCRGKRMVVVGDYIQDRYEFCDATGIASEGPMMTLRPLGSRTFDGAAAVIALHLAGLGAPVTLVTSLADDAASAVVVDRLGDAGIDVQFVRQRKSLVTKTRYLADQSKLFKVDDGATTPLDSRAERSVAELIAAASAGADGVVFADFGYGLITAPLLDRVLPRVRSSVPIVTADVSGRQSTLLNFAGVDLLCPTEREVRQTLNNFSSGLNAVVYELLDKTRASAAMITLGKQGMCLFDDRQKTGPGEAWDRKLRAAYLPAMSRNAVDPLGCGDALLATASLVLAAGGSRQAAAYLGSLAAGMQAQQVGNPAISIDGLMSLIHPPATRVMPQRLAS